MVKTALKDRLRRHEGYSSTVYNDSGGIPHIGYGFKLKSLELSRYVCDLILSEKIMDIRERCYHDYPWFIYQHPVAKDVIIELVYQLGFTGFSKFELTIRYLRMREYDKAADELLDSKLARYDAPKRTEELAELLRSCRDGKKD